MINDLPLLSAFKILKAKQLISELFQMIYEGFSHFDESHIIFDELLLLFE